MIKIILTFLISLFSLPAFACDISPPIPRITDGQICITTQSCPGINGWVGGDEICYPFRGIDSKTAEILNRKWIIEGLEPNQIESIIGNYVLSKNGAIYYTEELQMLDNIPKNKKFLLGSYRSLLFFGEGQLFSIHDGKYNVIETGLTESNTQFAEHNNNILIKTPTHLYSWRSGVLRYLKNQDNTPISPKNIKLGGSYFQHNKNIHFNNIDMPIIATTTNNDLHFSGSWLRIGNQSFQGKRKVKAKLPKTFEAVSYLSGEYLQSNGSLFIYNRNREDFKLIIKEFDLPIRKNIIMNNIDTCIVLTDKDAYKCNSRKFLVHLFTYKKGGLKYKEIKDLGDGSYLVGEDLVFKDQHTANINKIAKLTNSAGYALFQSSVYYRGRRIKVLDPATFHCTKGTNDCYDQFNQYHQGRIIGPNTINVAIDDEKRDSSYFYKNKNTEQTHYVDTTRAVPLHHIKSSTWSKSIGHHLVVDGVLYWGAEKHIVATNILPDITNVHGMIAKDANRVYLLHSPPYSRDLMGKKIMVQTLSEINTADFVLLDKKVLNVNKSWNLFHDKKSLYVLDTNPSPEKVKKLIKVDMQGIDYTSLKYLQNCNFSDGYRKYSACFPQQDGTINLLPQKGTQHHGIKRPFD